MNIPTFLSLYALSVPIFFAIDMLWLGVIARSYYQQQIGFLLGPVNWAAALLFYFVYLVGVTYFASYPAYQADSVGQAFLVGGLFGFFTYATYDMTNLATLRDWPWQVSVVDIIWGTVLGALVAGLSVLLARLILG